MKRRTFLHLAAGAATLPALSGLALAQAYPARPVRIIVGFAPGGTTDIVARLIGQALSERLGQQFIVENRLGAAANIAAETVVKAAPDGYTLLADGSTNAVNASVYEKLAFDFIRDITPVAGLTRSPLVLEVHPTLPVRTVPELIAYAKASPGKFSMASYGTATPSHVAGELLKMMTGINMVHVPYRGSGPMLSDLLGGQVPVAIDNLPASIEYIKTGKLRALAVTAASRSAALPDIPTLGETVQGYEASTWNGLGAPKNTPPDIIEKLHRQINTALDDPKLRARIADLGAETMSMSRAEFGNFIAADTEKWAKVVKFAGIKPE